jgi:hypothetical protein
MDLRGMQHRRVSVTSVDNGKAPGDSARTLEVRHQPFDESLWKLRADLGVSHYGPGIKANFPKSVTW